MGFFGRMKIYTKAIDVTIGIEQVLKNNYSYLVNGIRDIPPDLIIDLLKRMMTSEKHNFGLFYEEIKDKLEEQEDLYEKIEGMVFFMTKSYVYNEGYHSFGEKENQQIYDATMEFMEKIKPVA